jgi:hypothetical protein
MTADLREIRNAAGERIGLEHAYRTMSFDAFEAAISCPRCYCNKSGVADEANRRTEACDNADCPCHEETPA